MEKMFDISRIGSFEAEQFCCELLKKNVQAFFGPNTVETSGIVSSIAHKFEIPHFLYHWKTKPMWTQLAANDHDMTVNFYPDSDVLGEKNMNI